MSTSRVGIRDLKNDLSRCVARARPRHGDPGTDRGAPVAASSRSGAPIAAGVIEAGVIEPRPRARANASRARASACAAAGPSMVTIVARSGGDRLLRHLRRGEAVIVEAESSEAARIWRDARRVVSSVLMYPESRAALKRARRERRLTAPAPACGHGVRRPLGAGRSGRRVDRPATRAGVLAHDHDLRGYDAVHLASAESIAWPDVVFVGADRDLCGRRSRAGARRGPPPSSVSPTAAAAACSELTVSVLILHRIG